MIYYAKQIDKNGNIVALHSMSIPFPDSTEFIPIAEDEYLELLAEMTPETPEPTDEISDSEALAIITGGAAV